tara:strand:- start:118 stop:327 length:210 start_codon:yes stop_codon:yes gene_type:complete
LNKIIISKLINKEISSNLLRYEKKLPSKFELKIFERSTINVVIEIRSKIEINKKLNNIKIYLNFDGDNW